MYNRARHLLVGKIKIAKKTRHLNLVFVLLLMAIIGCKGSTDARPISISGDLDYKRIANFPTIGLFDIELDTTPLGVSKPNLGSWSLKLPDESQNLTTYRIVAWNDADGDGTYDPETEAKLGTGRLKSFEPHSCKACETVITYFQEGEGGLSAGFYVQASLMKSPEPLSPNYITGWIIK